MQQDEAGLWEPVLSLSMWWDACSHVAEGWWTRRAGPSAITAAQQERLTALVRHARRASSFYARHYAAVPEEGWTLASLPPVTRAELMADFDGWVTDPAVTRASVAPFLADRARVGERWQGRYHLWTSTGTSGVPGIYVQNDEAMAVYDALLALQWGSLRLPRAVDPLQLRAALVVATEDHFASIVSWKRAARAMPSADMRAFSVLDALSRRVAALNAFQPVFLAGYPTALEALADEQRAGRLRIAPLAIWSGGEGLAPHAQAGIERAFGCEAINEYGASECMSIAFGCRSGALHLNADWVILEPVDRWHRPVPPGVASHSVLLTNLANRVAPVLRYDLGDSVRFHARPCPCGNALPAFTVEGRRDEVLIFDRHGEEVRVLPLALSTVVELALGHGSFAIVQTRHDTICLQLPAGASRSRRAAWLATQAALRDWLDAQGLERVAIVLDEMPLVVQPAHKRRRIRVALEPGMAGRDRGFDAPMPRSAARHARPLHGRVAGR